MNGLPAEMIDRWQDRPEPAPGEGLIYWHMLVGTDPDVIALAREARRKLAPFTGLHLTPYAWLHMTALIAGSASEISEEQIRQMATAAGRRLADVPPITVTVGKILFILKRSCSPPSPPRPCFQCWRPSGRRHRR